MLRLLPLAQQKTKISPEIWTTISFIRKRTFYFWMLSSNKKCMSSMLHERNMKMRSEQEIDASELERNAMNCISEHFACKIHSHVWVLWTCKFVVVFYLCQMHWSFTTERLWARFFYWFTQVLWVQKQFLGSGQMSEATHTDFLYV